MEFAAEKEKAEMEKHPIASSLGGSWWWPNVKPFVNGGSAALISSSQFHLLGTAIHYHIIHLAKSNKELVPEPKKVLLNRERLEAYIKRQPVPLFLEAIISATALGSFEILTKKASVANNGIPLSILQEACCAVFAGFIGACPAAPVLLVEHYIQANANLQKPKYLSYRNALEALYQVGAKKGVSALWRYGISHAKGTVAFYTGMLAPYNRSFDYFKVSYGFDDSRASLGAGAVSAFFASACSVPVSNVQATMRNMKPNADGKYPYTCSLDCALKILSSRGALALYTAFPLHLARITPRIMMTWIMLGEIWKLEESIGI